MKKRILVATILFSILFFVSSPAVQSAGDFLGDFCWSVDNGSGNDFTTKVGVFHIGGSHYQLLGTSKLSTDDTYTVHGNAEIIENEIHANTIAADGNNNAMSTIHSLAVLDPSTLNGTYNTVHTTATETGQTAISYSTGTMTSIPCQ